jgi:predicted DNA-binding transcriptional regulator YafY
MRRADRLFQIILLLGRGRVTTSRQLAEALEVSERTVYRDIADLIASGAPIDGEAGVGYLLRPGFHLPPLMFSVEELQALVLGMRMVTSWSDPALGRAAQSALTKVETVLPPERRAAVESSAFVVPDFHVPPAMVEPLERLRGAILTNRKARFEYQRADGERSARTVWPLGLFFWGGTWTLGAWCELRQDFRTFRMDRMSTVEVLADTFEARRDSLLRDYMRAASE